MQKNKSVPHSLWGVLWKGTYYFNLPGLFATCTIQDNPFLKHIEGFYSSLYFLNENLIFFFLHKESLSWQHP